MESCARRFERSWAAGVEGRARGPVGQLTSVRADRTPRTGALPTPAATGSTASRPPRHVAGSPPRCPQMWTTPHQGRTRTARPPTCPDPDPAQCGDPSRTNPPEDEHRPGRSPDALLPSGLIRPRTGPWFRSSWPIRPRPPTQRSRPLRTPRGQRVYPGVEPRAGPLTKHAASPDTLDAARM